MRGRNNNEQHRRSSHHRFVSYLNRRCRHYDEQQQRKLHEVDEEAHCVEGHCDCSWIEWTKSIECEGRVRNTLKRSRLTVVSCLHKGQESERGQCKVGGINSEQLIKPT